MPDDENVSQPEVVEEVVELGEDITALFKSAAIETFTFEHEGKRWTWKYRHVTWAEHFKCIEDAYEVKTTVDEVTGFPKDETIFTAAKYYEDILMLALQSGPGGTGITRQILRQLDSPIIQRLTTIVPSAKLEEGLADSKKS